jgi:hypothetical protein
MGYKSPSHSLMLLPQSLPPGKEYLVWVTNTVTLIYGALDCRVFCASEESMSRSRSRTLVSRNVFHRHMPVKDTPIVVLTDPVRSCN